MASIADELIQRAFEHVARFDGRIAALGCTGIAFEVAAQMRGAGLGERFLGIFDPSLPAGRQGVARPWDELTIGEQDLAVIADDRRKQALLSALAAGNWTKHDVPRVALAGVGHLEFSDALFDELDSPALIPSYATGYPYTRVHMFECLQAAARNNLNGVVVEFGSFKGGTTAWLARVVDRLQLDAKVIGFDSWSGFPRPRSVLDLYTHPRCVFTDEAAVRSHLEPLGVELIAGDITETASQRLQDTPVLLAFIDTDNYSPAKAALEAVIPNLVVGGAIVFDHFTTTAEYIYTIGERMAGVEMLENSGLLHLHSTGVFVKIS